MQTDQWVAVIIVLIFVAVVTWLLYSGHKSFNRKIVEMNDPTKWKVVKGGALVRKSDIETEKSAHTSEYGKGDS